MTKMVSAISASEDMPGIGCRNAEGVYGALWSNLVVCGCVDRCGRLSLGLWGHLGIGACEKWSCILYSSLWCSWTRDPVP